MFNFRSATFAKLTKKLQRANNEMQHVMKHAADKRAAISSGEWEAMTAGAMGVHNIYNDIEDILMTIAKDVDGSVPDGPSFHQDILDQMATDIPDLRHALFSDEQHQVLTELKNFRHLVRHRYGIELIGKLVLKNIEMIEKAFPEFVDSLFSLEAEITADHNPHDSPDFS